MLHRAHEHHLDLCKVYVPKLNFIKAIISCVLVLGVNAL